MISFLKRNVVALAGVAGALGLAVAGFCSASGPTLISLPSTAVADLTGYATGVFTDLWVVIALVIGIPLAFYVIRKVIGLFRSR